MSIVRHFDDEIEADFYARTHTPAVKEDSPYGGWDVWELGVRGADGVTRDRRYVPEEMA